MFHWFVSRSVLFAVCFFLLVGICLFVILCRSVFSGVPTFPFGRQSVFGLTVFIVGSVFVFFVPCGFCFALLLVSVLVWSAVGGFLLSAT